MWRPLNKVWVRIDAGHQIVMVIIERVYPSKDADSRWTAIDNARRLQEIDLSNTATYSRKPWLGAVREHFEGLTTKERERAVQASYDIVRAANGGHVARSLSALRESKTSTPRRKSGRDSTPLELLTSIGNAIAVGWSYRHHGAVGAGMFLAWRIWTWLGLRHVAASAKDAILNVKETYDHINFVLDEFWDSDDKSSYLPEDISHYLVYFCFVVALGVAYREEIHSFVRGRLESKAPPTPAPNPSGGWETCPSCSSSAGDGRPAWVPSPDRLRCLGAHNSPPRDASRCGVGRR